MLKVFAFYLVLWWFTKLENKTVLIVRAVLASVFAIFNLLSAIVVFTEPHIVKDGFAFIGIFALIPAVLFGLRAFFDIRKIISIVQTPKSKTVSQNKHKTVQTINYSKDLENFKQRLMKK